MINVLNTALISNKKQPRAYFRNFNDFQILLKIINTFYRVIISVYLYVKKLYKMIKYIKEKSPF